MNQQPISIDSALDFLGNECKRLNQIIEENSFNIWKYLFIYLFFISSIVIFIIIYNHYKFKENNKL
jgi:heme/copper-type cytochrome/quinol oxidase subunit 2